MIYHEFTETFLPMLYEQTPKKQKFTKANNSNFETKNLRKAIMKVQNFEINISVKEQTKRKVPAITKELST